MIIAIFGDSVLEGVRYENGKYSHSHELLQLFRTSTAAWNALIAAREGRTEE